MKKNVLTVMTLSGIIFLIATRCGQGPDKGLFELEVLNESSITMIDQLLGIDLASLANPIPDSVMDRIILIATGSLTVCSSWPTLKWERI